MLSSPWPAQWPPLDSLQYIRNFPVLGSPKLDIVFQMPSHQCQTEGRISSLALLASPLLMQPKMPYLLQGHTAKHSVHLSLLILQGVFLKIFMCISWKGGMCWCVVSQPRAPHLQRSHFTSAPSPSSSRHCLYLTTFPSIPVPCQLKITTSKLNLEMRGETRELLGFFCI